MNSKILLTSLLVSLSLTACSSTTPINSEPALLLPTAIVCCDDFSQFPWIQLNDTEEIDFQLEVSSPVGHFSDGNSYFNAFKLSPRSQKVTLGIASLMVNSSVVVPKIITLDDTFNIVDIVSLDQFELNTSSGFTRTKFQLNIELDATETPYFIVYSSNEYLGQSIKVKHPARIRAEELGEPIPMVTDPTYYYDRFGKLILSVETLSLKATKALVKKAKPKVIPIQAETQAFYKNAIIKAVNINDIAKALSLLEEAKKLGIKNMQTIFINALAIKK